MPSAYITIIRVNDAPVVTLGLNATVDVTLMYLENQSQPLLLAQNIQINGVYMSLCVCMCVYCMYIMCVCILCVYVYCVCMYIVCVCIIILCVYVFVYIA